MATEVKEGRSAAVAVTPANPPALNTLRKLLEKNKAQIDAALPKHMSVERMIRVSLTAFLRTPDLADCSVESVCQSVMDAAALGLEPDGVLGHAYLVPYKGKCTLIPGYKGYVALAYRSGQVSSFGAQVVYQNDHFSFRYGLDQELSHRPNLEVESIEQRGKRICAYATCHMKDGACAFVVLPMYEVERLRARSKAPNSPAWKNDYDAMASKTAVRQLAKWIPQCPELQRAAGKEDMMDADLDLEDTSIEVTSTPVDEAEKKSTATKSDALAEKLKGGGNGNGGDEKPKVQEAKPESAKSDSIDLGTAIQAIHRVADQIDELTKRPGDGFAYLKRFAEQEDLAGLSAEKLEEIWTEMKGIVATLEIEQLNAESSSTAEGGEGTQGSETAARIDKPSGKSGSLFGRKDG